MAIKISVIIPVYNVAEYLPECLDSIIGQSLPELEIICVNDGSTDNSGEILQQYAAKDKRVKIISQPNAGVSAARNAGLAAARGEYVSFVDGDDFIDAETYGSLWKEMGKARPDIVIFRYANFYKGEIQASAQANPLFAPGAPQPGFADLVLKLGATVTFKLFRRDFLEQGRIRFPQGIARGEDTLFNMECFARHPAVRLVNRICYFYRIFRPNSTMASPHSLNEPLAMKKHLEQSSFYPKLPPEEKMVIDLNIANILVYSYKRLPPDAQKPSIAILQDYLAALQKEYSAAALASFAVYGNMAQTIRCNRLNIALCNGLKHFFSIQNSISKRHKIICFCGFKIKLRRKRISFFSLFYMAYCFFLYDVEKTSCL